MSLKPSRYALSQSKARIFVGQLEPYVTEQDLFPVFSAYGKILHLNVVRHSTTVTPNEERRIPAAFVWYETTSEADAAIAALHNVFTFSSPDEEESKKRYIQVSYADKTPECTAWGKWQKRHAEITRRSAPQTATTAATNNNSSSNNISHHDNHTCAMISTASTQNSMLTLNDASLYGNNSNNNNIMSHLSSGRSNYANYGSNPTSATSHHNPHNIVYHPHTHQQQQQQHGSVSYFTNKLDSVSHVYSPTSSCPNASWARSSNYKAETLTARGRPSSSNNSHRPILPHSHSVPVFTSLDQHVISMSQKDHSLRASPSWSTTHITNAYGHGTAITCRTAGSANVSMSCYYDSHSSSPIDVNGMKANANTMHMHTDSNNSINYSVNNNDGGVCGYAVNSSFCSPNGSAGPLSYPHALTRHGMHANNSSYSPLKPYSSLHGNLLASSFASSQSTSTNIPSVVSGRNAKANNQSFASSRVADGLAAVSERTHSRHASFADSSASMGRLGANEDGERSVCRMSVDLTDAM